MKKMIVMFCFLMTLLGCSGSDSDSVSNTATLSSDQSAALAELNGIKLMNQR